MTTPSQRALILYRSRCFINHLLTYLLIYLRYVMLKLDLAAWRNIILDPVGRVVFQFPRLWLQN